MSEEIIKDLKHFEYVTSDKYEVVEELLKKGYEEKEIIDAFDSYPFKTSWNGNALVGILMIVLAIFIGVSIKSTLGSFDYELDSSGDFFRLNEWVLKPLLLISLLIIGINILINRGLFNKNLKKTMIVLFILFMASSIGSNSPLSLLFGAIGIALMITLKKKQIAALSPAQLILNSIDVKTPSKKEVLAFLNMKNWHGSTLFVFLLLSFVLLISSPIDVSKEMTDGGGLMSLSRTFELTTLDAILLATVKVLFLGSLVTAILVSIHLKKFRYVLMGTILFAVIHIILSVMHRNFQTSIIPSLLLCVSGLYALFSHKLLPRKSKAK